MDPISIQDRVSSSYQTDEEVKKIKAVKIPEIKDQHSAGKAVADLLQHRHQPSGDHGRRRAEVRLDTSVVTQTVMSTI